MAWDTREKGENGVIEWVSHQMYESLQVWI